MKTTSWKTETKVFAVFLVIAAVAMAWFEVTKCDLFIGYMDGKLYYQYLPEWFIERNFSFYVKYPFGTALMELPFFMIAHLLTLLINPTNATGYGGLYEYAVGFAGIFYCIFGLILLFIVLKNHFDHRSALLAVLVLMIGTPLPYYATKYSAFSHIYTFAAASFFVFLTDCIDKIEDAERQNAPAETAGNIHSKKDIPQKWEPVLHFLLGITAGLLFLIRNVNAGFVLFYLLKDFGIFSKTAREKYKNHLRYLLSPKHLFPNILGGLLVVFPQLLYWKHTTGAWLLNTYSDEHFTFLLRPKFYEVLFSDAKGFLILSPAMILAVVGFFFLKKTGGRRYFASCLVLSLYELYLTAAWWCWWLGGVYGIRTLLDIQPFLAFPLAAFFLWLKEAAASLDRSGKGFFIVGYTAIFFVLLYANLAFLSVAQNDMLNETFASWWQLKNAL